MRLPLTIDDHDVVVDVVDADAPIGELTTVAGSTTHTALVAAGRVIAPDGTIAAAALRPGTAVRTPRTAVADDPPPVAPGTLAIHVIAGVGAGQVVALVRDAAELPTVVAPAGRRRREPEPPPPPEFTVGRSAGADVTLASPAISKLHCAVTVTVTVTGDGDGDGDTIRIRDLGSRNGTYVDGSRIGTEWRELPVDTPVGLGPAVFVVRRTVADDPPAKVAELLTTAPTGPVPFYRSPVDLVAGPPEAVPAPAPPRKPRTGRPGLIAFVLPLIFAAVMVRITGQIFYALFALMGPVMITMNLLDRAGRNRRIRRKSRRRFAAELVEFRADLDALVASEQRRRRAMHPDLAELVRRAEAAGAALWDRRPSHPQYLTLSVGVGDLGWEVPLGDLPEGALDHDGIADAIAAASVLPVVPLALALTPGATVGLCGERRGALATARGMLVQAAVHHGPAELRIIVVCHAASAGDWDWAKWLPHVRPSSFGEGRMLVVTSDDDGRIDGGMLDDVLADAEAGAALLVVIDTAGLSDAGDLAVRRLLRKSTAATSGLVLAPQSHGLPDLATVVVEHHDTVGEATCRWPLEGGRTTAVVIGGTDTDTAERTARALARLSDPDAGGGSASLPARVSLSELLGVEGVTAAELAGRWTQRGTRTAVLGRGETGTVAVGFTESMPHLVVVGGRSAGKTETLTAIAVGLATQFSPTQVQLLLWGESFGPLGRLPHTANAVNRVDDNTVTVIVEGLDREFTRRERLRSKGGNLDDEPTLMVVIDDIDTIIRLVPRAADDLVRVFRRARGLGVHLLWSTSRASGTSITDLIDLSPLRVVLRVGSTTESNDLLGIESAAHLERSLPGRGYAVAGGSDAVEVQIPLVTAGLPTSGDELRVLPFELARTTDTGPVTLGPPDLRGLLALLSAAGAGMPRPTDLLSAATAAATALESPGLPELLGVGTAALQTLPERWQTFDTDSFLRVPIGVDPEMRPVVVDLRESALSGMGPHGLMVGATGSGKSELLRTLVSGLAATHSPEMLAFVLVDFKGGASFASYAKLPHVAGVVTNLADDLALVDRILAALGGEQKRRQELLAAAGNLGNVREYRAARRAGKLPPELAEQPLPQLLVIVDEFAELLDQEPAFIDFFLTIGRVGRSLGIHLLLASQRLEEGKLRGLDTYLSYRLGLRTFSAAESRTVLGVPDAFSLPSAPGGGYLKVGNTAFERFQASYVSGPLRAELGAGDAAPDAAGEPDGPAAPSDPADPDAASSSEAADATPAADLDGASTHDEHDDGPTVMEAIIDVLAASGHPRVHQIWLPPLEPAIALDRLFAPAGFVHDPDRGFAAARWPRTGGLAVPIGVVDEPELQRQLPLVLDFTGAHGNLVVTGAPQSGKSVLLRTLVTALAVTHTPAEVQIYAADFGGGTLDALAELPHVGSVASRLEPEKVARLLSYVEGIVTRREELFRQLDIDSAATFRQLRAAGQLPPDVGGDVFLLIDGWAAFKEKFDAYEPLIADLVARGLGYGVHVVITATRWLEIRSQIIEAIGGRLELHVNNPADSNIDRRKAAVIRADQPGRGLHPSKRIFQVCLPRLDGADTTEQLQAATKIAVDSIAGLWEGPVATPIRLLPHHFGLDDLDAAVAADLAEFGAGTGETTGDETSSAKPPPGTAVGLVEDQMRPWYLDLDSAEPHFLVYGDGESGKTTLLRTWLTRMCASRPREEVRVILVDYRRTLLEVVPPSHLAGYAASEPATRELIEQLVVELEARLPGADVTPRQLRERSWWTGPDVYVVVDDYDLVATQSGNPLQPLLPYLAQGRDLGLHVVLARRVAGASKSAFEAVTSRIREVSPVGVMLSGDRDEGAILGGLRASVQPPGRGTLIRRREQPTLVQIAETPPPEDRDPDETDSGPTDA